MSIINSRLASADLTRRRSRLVAVGCVMMVAVVGCTSSGQVLQSQGSSTPSSVVLSTVGSSPLNRDQSNPTVCPAGFRFKAAVQSYFDVDLVEVSDFKPGQSVDESGKPQPDDYDCTVYAEKNGKAVVIGTLTHIRTLSWAAAEAEWQAFTPSSDLENKGRIDLGRVEGVFAQRLFPTGYIRFPAPTEAEGTYSISFIIGNVDGQYALARAFASSIYSPVATPDVVEQSLPGSAGSSPVEYPSLASSVATPTTQSAEPPSTLAAAPNNTGQVLNPVAVTISTVAAAPNNGATKDLSVDGPVRAGSLVAAGAYQLPGAFEPLAFVTPSGNITCNLFASDRNLGANVSCDIGIHTYPTPIKPPNFCVGDYGFRMGVGVQSGALVECRSDPLAKATMVLQYGRSIVAGAVSCLSTKSGVRCELSDGRAFIMSKDELVVIT